MTQYPDPAPDEREVCTKLGDRMPEPRCELRSEHCNMVTVVTPAPGHDDWTVEHLGYCRRRITCKKCGVSYVEDSGD